MDFTKQDKAYILKLYGGTQKTFDEDIGQIGQAAEVTEYTIYSGNGDDEKPITKLGVIRKIGREGWLSGLVRSAFHWTSTRETPDGRFIHFDSRKLFK